MPISLQEVKSRVCGPCCACCKVLGIPEVPTERNVWCQHANKPNGCRIYADRPAPCRDFRCLWLDGQLPEWARPDKIHGVVMAVADHVLQISEDPGWPGEASRVLEPLLQGIYADGRYVSVVCGDDWRVRGTQAALAQIEQVSSL